MGLVLVRARFFKIGRKIPGNGPDIEAADVADISEHAHVGIGVDGRLETR